jgi:hypothetical protein
MNLKLPPDLGPRLIEDSSLRWAALWGAVIGFLVGFLAFGLPLAAIFGKGGDNVVGWVMIVLILGSAAVGAYVGLRLATRE